MEKAEALKPGDRVYVNTMNKSVQLYIIGSEPLEKGLKQLKGKHVIYYDASNLINSYLEGKEYKTGGGWLRPMK